MNESSSDFCWISCKSHENENKVSPTQNTTQSLKTSNKMRLRMYIRWIVSGKTDFHNILYVISNLFRNGFNGIFPRLQIWIIIVNDLRWMIPKSNNETPVRSFIFLCLNDLFYIFIDAFFFLLIMGCFALFVIPVKSSRKNSSKLVLLSL
jgi:hypothetical protein